MQPKNPWTYIAPKKLEIDHWTVLHAYIYIYIYLCSFLLSPRVQKRCQVSLFRRLGSSFFLEKNFRLWQPDRIRDDILIGDMTSTTGFPDIPQPWIPWTRLDKHCRSFRWLGSRQLGVKSYDVSMDCHDSGTCDMWAYPFTTNQEGIGTSKGSSYDLWTRNHQWLPWLVEWLLWWTMVQTCSNMLII